MATIKNFTPHNIVIIAEDGTIVKEYPSQGVARATQTSSPVGEIDGIEVVKMAFGATTDLPAPEDGVYLIVSAITVSAARAEGRSVDDLLISADPVRDDSGRILGCRRLAIPAA